MVGIVLIGQSNSGKSAIGKEVAERLGIRYISSGDIARSMTDAQDILNSGGMAPEERMRDAVLRKIASCNISYILDGFPRFQEQCKWLENAVNHQLAFVYITVPNKDILERAKLRGRDDDGSIERKMKYFEENTEPMISYIIEDTLHDIFVLYNGNGTLIDDNINKLKEFVEGYLC